MARKNKEADKQYQQEYYEKHIKGDEEKRKQKNEQQREYAKRTKYASQTKYGKEKTKRYTISAMVNTEQDIIQKLDSVDNKNGYIKSLIRADIEKSK